MKNLILFFEYYIKINYIRKMYYKILFIIMIKYKNSKKLIFFQLKYK